MNSKTKYTYMYLDEVKAEFGDHPQVYHEFLHIMRTFKSQEIDIPEVIFRVTQLFHSNQSLVLGFNTFLPDGFQIVIPNQDTGSFYYRTAGQPLVLIPTTNTRTHKQEHDSRQQQEQQEQQNNSYTYIADIKRTFANDPDTYERFWGVLDSYRRKQRGVQQVLEEVFVLFAGHPVLLRDFAYFFLSDVQ